MKIGVIGLGFVGLTTATGFASKGFDVLCYEKDAQKSKDISNLDIPFYEPKLKNKLKENLQKKLVILNNLENLVISSKIIFVCVGTPSNKQGAADLSYIMTFIKELIKIKPNNNKIICIKSTVPPGSCEKISLFLEKNYKKNNIKISFSPEFLREGYAWSDFINPDRIVIGSKDATARNELKKFFSCFNSEIYLTSLEEAEFIKYLSNNLLANLISFSNEMSMIANNIGNMNIKKIFKILHSDKRWTGNPASMASYVFPGVGFGGYCLPKDLKAMIYTAKNHKVKPKILKAVDEVNKDIKIYNINKVLNEISSKKEAIGIIGLSFKTGSDDIRETPSLYYIKELLKKGFKNISVFDELANPIFSTTYPKLKISYYDHLQKIIRDNNTIIIILNQKGLEKINFKNKNIIDLRYIL